MLLFSWLRSRTLARPLHAQRRPSASRFRPQLEVLEGRDVPSTLTVTNNLDFGGGTLRADIAAANPGDTINFAPSFDGQTIQLDSQLIINKNLNIQGPGAGLLAIRPAAHSNVIAYPRIFEVAVNVTLNLSGLTLENGGGTALGSYYGNSGFPSPDPWDAYGGAILNFGALTVSGCNLLNNSVLPASSHAMYGGAIYNAGTLTLTDSTLSGNSASFYSGSSYVGRGGAIYNAGTASISDCTLTGNTAGYGYSLGQGGAIFNAGPLSLNGCTLSGNSASLGGGILNRTSAGSAVTLNNDTLKSNAATTAGGAGSGLGGGLDVDYGTLTLTNDTVQSNQAATAGGGLYVDYGTLTLTNDTVQSNQAATAGGGMYIAAGAVVYLDAFTLDNVINNTAHKYRNIDGSFVKL
jgi:hypothetical protein